MWETHFGFGRANPFLLLLLCYRQQIIPYFQRKGISEKKERGRGRREINFGTYWQLILRGIEILRLSTNMWETDNCFFTYSSFPWRNICVEKEGNRGECECVCTYTICRHLPAGGMDGTAGAGKKVSEEGPPSLFFATTAN